MDLRPAGLRAHRHRTADRGEGVDCLGAVAERRRGPTEPLGVPEVHPRLVADPTGTGSPAKSATPARMTASSAPSGGQHDAEEPLLVRNGHTSRRMPDAVASSAAISRTTAKAI